jgi:MYXO-CTERM domain-containing protein
MAGGGAGGASGGTGLGGLGGLGSIGTLEGGGCSCSLAAGSSRWLGGWALGMAGLGLWVTRRRRRV